MSLPIPTTSPSTAYVGDPNELQMIDAPLIALVNRCNGDLRQLLFAFFNFLYRRTDFYVIYDDTVNATPNQNIGFKEGDAEKLLLAAFRQFPLRKLKPPSSPSTSKQQQQKQSSSPPAATKTAAKNDEVIHDDEKQPPSSELEKSSICERNNVATKDGTTTAVRPKTGEKVDTGNEEGENSTSVSSSSLVSTIRYTEEGLQIPVGNGGTTQRYTWTQTLDECTVMIGTAMPPGTIRGKDFSVTMKSNFISVKTKHALPGKTEPTVYVEGELTEKIIPSESSWTIDDTGILIVILYKQQKTFWKTIIVGDDEIDATLVDSRRSVSTYDAATQGQIRKITFDQNQIHHNLPTSDEMVPTKPIIPPLPPGVEYIDQSIVDAAQPKK